MIIYKVHRDDGEWMETNDKMEAMNFYDYSESLGHDAYIEVIKDMSNYNDNNTFVSRYSYPCTRDRM